MSGGDNYDFCEYVYNPLMRQYQAMMRLMSMLRDSQSDCNDVQCFTNENANDPANPFSAVGGPASSSFASFIPVLFIWAMFVFALFMFRPASMRGNGNKDADKAKLNNKRANSHLNRRFFRDDHDDDNSTVS